MRDSVKVIIKNEKGIHARVAAIVVHKVDELEKKYNVQFFIYKNTKKVPAKSLMPLVLLKIKQNEEILLEAVGDRVKEPLGEMGAFLQSDFNISDESTISQVDNIIHDNTIAWEQIFESLANGLIVLDENDIITVFNPMAEKILNVKANEAIGKNIYEIIPKEEMGIICNNGKSKIGLRKEINNTIVLLNETPILIEGNRKGSVISFQDISNIEKLTGELKEVKELKERLQLVLDSVQDGICVIDKEGYVTYANEAYYKILKEEPEKVIGVNISHTSPNGLRQQVLLSGNNKRGVIVKKPNGVVMAADVSAIKVYGEIRGVVSVVKDLTQIRKLYKNLNEITAKAEYLEEELFRTKKPNEAFKKFIGNSGKVRDALAIATKAAKSYSTVLIRGESGTGKELIAEGIHFASSCADGPFIRVNCAAIPSNLLESELFGHEKGSFTGAIKRKLGKFELANKGTIFLDEIGETDKSMQAKLLRVLQEREFQRVGGEETIKINVRIIAATNRNLEDMVKRGDFREDLYYRLNVIPIFLPPLRERKQDIPILVEYFIEKISREMKKDINGISNKALDTFIKYKWPGNVRELENLIERVVALSEDEYIENEDLPIYIKQDNSDDKLENLNNVKEKKNNIKSEIENSEEILKLSDYEKIIIEKALKKYGSYNAAAKVLGVTHKTVAAKARKYGIQKVISWEK
ncbi:sigma 54-interacting transcriptional regulator [Clostridium ganghwense]|uniref:HTH-type transcriptional regulatory protein TyrR n=1 Tax=Clostridium ganghwense TaxID=312089 RepID=A0ABT4CP51_9CLOT|nr:sigma 54-interacting transcriptional regulator [Clostridium ganghwense]MCY6370836.1 sigma 54-interacting transcriptional regulator [Clostridium ganghwense]